MGQRPVGSHACGVRDASQGGEHAAGEKPPAHESEDQQERQHDGHERSECTQEDGAVDHQVTGGVDRTVGWVQVEDDHGGEQQGTCEHEEPGVAEGEFEANTQTRGSIHGLLPRARCLVEC